MTQEQHQKLTLMQRLDAYDRDVARLFTIDDM